MDILALGAAVSVLVTVLVAGSALLTTSAATQMRGRLEGMLSGTAVMEGSLDTLRSTHVTFGTLQNILSGSWARRIERELRLADSELHATDFIAIRIGLGVLGFMVPFVLFAGAIGIVLGLVAGLMAFMLPQMWITRRRKKRNKKLEEQLPEALMQVANSLRAGFGLLKALSLASEQLTHPISTELGQVVHETSVGSSTEEAFLALNERNASYDLDLVVTAISVQRSTGGNLAEILDTVAETMRERVRIRGEINTLTAQQRLTGIVIGLMPVGVGGMFFMLSPDYITPLFTEPLGRVMLGVGVFMEAVGIMIIQRILNIEV
jgi:tight adherence protein B